MSNRVESRQEEKRNDSELQLVVNYVLDFSQITPENGSLVGSKGHNLSMMYQAGLPVPAGFCVTTEAYDGYVAAVNNCEVDEYGLPPALSAQIKSFYDQLHLSETAVRSSANVEDLRKAGSAGAYYTALNCNSITNILSSVHQCFESLQKQEAIEYRKRQGITEEAKMAVVVMEMVPDVSAAGVLFTTDPISGDPNKVIVNSVYGLGEQLVSGAQTGDAYTYDRIGNTVAVETSPKLVKLTAKGIEQVALSEQNLPSLSANQIKELAIFGDKIEHIFGGHQDVEFAYSGGKPYILQARPITAEFRNLCTIEALTPEAYLSQEKGQIRLKLGQLRRDGLLEYSPAIMTDFNISELLPTPTPMAFGTFTYIFANEGAIQIGRRGMGYEIGSETSQGFYELVAGHPYVNLEIDAKTFNVGFPLDIADYISEIQTDISKASYPELGLYQQKLTFDEAVSRFGPENGPQYFAKYQAFFESISHYGVDYLNQFTNQIEPQFEKYISDEKGINYRTLSTDQLVLKCHEILEHMRTYSCVHFVYAARLGFFATERLKRHVSELLPDHDKASCLLNDLLSGLQASKITEERQAHTKVARGEMSQTDYMDKFGHLATNELEISLPRKSEQRIVFLNDGNLQKENDGQERRSVAEANLNSLIQSLSPDKKIEISTDMYCSQNYLPLRETIKYYFTHEYAFLREALLILQEKRGFSGDDVFYLYPNEIDRLANPSDNLLPLLQKRQIERRLSLQLEKQGRIPAVFFENEILHFGDTVDISGKTEFTGNIVAWTKEQIEIKAPIEGEVIIIDSNNFNLEEIMGEIRTRKQPPIIVTTSANLGMDPLIVKSGGLIMETGGILAHGACRARENGISAVVLPNSTTIFATGDTIRISPDGHVTLINHNNHE